MDFKAIYNIINRRNTMTIMNNILPLIFFAILTSCGCDFSDKQHIDTVSNKDIDGWETKNTNGNKIVSKQFQSSNTFEFEYDSAGIPLKKIYSTTKDKSKCFFVISKIHPEHLSVYESIGNDTVLLAVYPVCLSKNKGQKERKGDNRTPESYPGEPFFIQQIQDASNWYHDFNDGRGPILAYGHWFMRLNTPGFSGIGIHGSTGNRESIIKGRGSEGCIRLLDEDIIHLHDYYATKGTKVIILPENMKPLPFEEKALEMIENGI